MIGMLDILLLVAIGMLVLAALLYVGGHILMARSGLTREEIDRL